MTWFHTLSLISSDHESSEVETRILVLAGLCLLFWDRLACEGNRLGLTRAVI
jgi:hypothetical protein